MSIIALIGLAIGAAGFYVAFPRESRRIDIYLALYGVHLAAAVGYWWLARDEGYDAFFYYGDPAHWVSRPIEPGTIFVIHLVQWLRGIFDGSFLDYFLLFQSMGMIGIALFLRSMFEIAKALDTDIPRWLYLLAVLPGIHFWTVAIGKDAPLFMAVALSVWASMRIQVRFPWMAAAILVMLLFRPHVAAIACLAISASFVLDRRISFVAKSLLAPVTLAGLTYVLATLKTQIGLDTLDANSVTTYVETTQAIGQQYGGEANLMALPFPLKVASLLFRPLFFDAHGALGLVASFENAMLLGMVIFMAAKSATTARLSRTVFYLGYSTFFAIALVLLLALLNYNVGLGLRQKVMAMPAILIIFATLILHKRSLRQLAISGQYAAKLHPQAATGA